MEIGDREYTCLVLRGQGLLRVNRSLKTEQLRRKDITEKV